MPVSKNNRKKCKAKRIVGGNPASRITYGNANTYIREINKHLKDADKLIAQMTHTLDTYGSLLQQHGDAIPADIHNLIVECCGTVAGDCDVLRTTIGRIRLDTQSLNNEDGGVSLHFRAGELATELSDAIDTASRLYQISLQRIDAAIPR